MISIARAPKAGLVLVSKNVVLANATSNLEMAVRRAPTTLKPHPLYTVNVDGVLDKRLLARCKRTAWQYILVQGGDPIGLAEVASNRDGRPGRLAYAARYSDEYAKVMLAAMEAARVELENSPKDYALRILRAPAIYLQAVWMHAKDDDVFFPIAPVPAAIEPNKRITEAELTERLLPLARQRAAANDRG